MATGDKKPVVMQADRAIPNGVATLDKSGVLDSLQWPDVDNFGAADRVLSNLTDPAKALSNIGAASNPNLLDNWYFADPVDQRGGYVTSPTQDYYAVASSSSSLGKVGGYYKATYYNADFYTFTKDETTYYVRAAYVLRGYTGSGYAIDRLIIQQITNTRLLIADGYVALTATNNDGLFQRLPIEQFTDGDILTISVLTADGELMTKTVILSTTVTKYAYNDIWYCAIGYNNGGFWICWPIITYAGSEQTINIKAAKLELGSTQTLAHQDADGNWVLNDPPPDKHLELLKCCMSTADSSDTYANNKLTPAAINAVNKAGDTMTGALVIDNGNVFTAVRKYRTISDVLYQMSIGLGIVATAPCASLQLMDTNSTVIGRINVLETGPTYQDAGLSHNYTILHTGNKPSGSYTGNGSATSRTIETGAIGGVIAIWNLSSAPRFAIIGPVGGVALTGSGAGVLYTSDVNFSGGKLTLKSTSDVINANGVTYYYQVL